MYNPVVRFGKVDVLGKTDVESASAGNPVQLMETERSVLEGTGTRFEATRLDGTDKRYLDVALEPLRDSAGRVIDLTGAAVDITDRKYLQEWLEKVNLELDRAIAGRVEELEAASVRLRSLTRESVAVQEDERLRVSRELHDEAGQALAALKMNVEDMRDQVPAQLPVLRSRMDEIAVLVSRTLEEVRTSRPAPASARCRRSGRNDGRDFDPEMLDVSPELHRIGLVGMQERRRIVGGSLDIDSEPGRGTRLAAHIPNEEAE